MPEVKGGGLGYIELGNDSLGLGALGTGIGGAIAAKAVDGCGTRPALFGKRKWNECVARNQDLKSQQLGVLANQPPPPNNTLIIAVVAVLVVVVLVVVIKK